MHKNMCVCFDEVICFIIMKIRLERKDRLQRYDINRPKPRHGHKCIKYTMCLSIMMVICIKPHLTNIWSSIHKKSYATLRLSWKKAMLIKKACIFTFFGKTCWYKQNETSNCWKDILSWFSYFSVYSYQRFLNLTKL